MASRGCVARTDLHARCVGEHARTLAVNGSTSRLRVSVCLSVSDTSCVFREAFTFCCVVAALLDPEIRGSALLALLHPGAKVLCARQVCRRRLRFRTRHACGRVVRHRHRRCLAGWRHSRHHNRGASRAERLATEWRRAAWGRAVTGHLDRHLAGCQTGRGRGRPMGHRLLPSELRRPGGAQSGRALDVGAVLGGLTLHLAVCRQRRAAQHWVRGGHRSVEATGRAPWHLRLVPKAEFHGE